MGKTRAVRPWTWRQIAGLRGRNRRGFIRTYGARGWAALVAAAHLYKDNRSISHRVYDWAYCGASPCYTCPMQTAVLENPKLTCYEAAMPVYARLIAERGLLPDGM